MRTDKTRVTTITLTHSEVFEALSDYVRKKDPKVDLSLLRPSIELFSDQHESLGAKIKITMVDY